MRTIMIGVACVAVGVAADALFLPHQSLWNDETCQMSGLSLDPVELTKWLANRADHNFGLARDRMPPLSYWVGWTWSRMTGLRETPMRWMGVVCVAIATAIVFATALRTWGLAAGVAAALLLATSPNVVMMSVEIRAYPMLILASAGIYACLLGYATSPRPTRRRWLAGMVACGILAMYTHFFGLVALGGALVSAFVLDWIDGEGVLPVVAAGGVTALAALGLAPFVMASTTFSQGAPGAAEGKLVGLARLSYRLFANPATSLSRVAVGLSAAGFVVGVLSGLAPKARRGSAAMALGLALVSGAAVVALAHLAQSSFEAARPNYNAWMLPPLAILIASGLAARDRHVRTAAALAIALSMATNLYADGQLAVRGDHFAHAPHRPIAEIIRRLGPSELVVILDGESRNDWDIYTPIHSEFRGVVRQLSYVPATGEAGAVRVTEYPSLKGEFDPIGLPYDHLIVVRSAPRFAQDIASQIHVGIVPLGDGPVTRALLASGGWERVEEETILTFVGADVDVFRRVARR